MATAVWTVFAVGVMLGIFAGCTIAVATGVRLLEGALIKRRQKRVA